MKHTYEVIRIAETMTELFQNLDRDFLITVAFLHDIGKVDEMRHDLIVEYTTVGKLLGHLEIGADITRKKIETIEGFPETAKNHLLHCILSHHGELENGSPVVPKSLEAMVLHHCDNLGAQADAISRIVGETRDKCQEWSEYIPLISRPIWTKDA